MRACACVCVLCGNALHACCAQLCPVSVLSALLVYKACRLRGNMGPLRAGTGGRTGGASAYVLLRHVRWRTVASDAAHMSAARVLLV